MINYFRGSYSWRVCNKYRIIGERNSKLHFQLTEEKLEVSKSSIQKDDARIPDISPIISGIENIFKTVKNYENNPETEKDYNDQKI